MNKQELKQFLGANINIKDDYMMNKLQENMRRFGTKNLPKMPLLESALSDDDILDIILSYTKDPDDAEEQLLAYRETGEFTNVELKANILRDPRWKNVNNDGLILTGPDEDELLDAIDILNRGQSSDILPASKYFTITLLDKTKHKINNTSVSFNVTLSPTGYKSPIPGKIYNSEKDQWEDLKIPNPNEYLRSANEYLETYGYKAKLYQL